MEDAERMMELKKQGFFCSQILLVMGLEMMGKENPELIRSVHGLAGGLGFSGDTCGVLSGGACLLGLYAGKGLPQEQDDPRLIFMIEDLVKWFKENFGTQYGGISCETIVGDSAKNQTTRCPVLTEQTFQKVKELLVENGFDLSGADRDS
jgi:hypothetical protein